MKSAIQFFGILLTLLVLAVGCRKEDEQSRPANQPESGKLEGSWREVKYRVQVLSATNAVTRDETVVVPEPGFPMGFDFTAGGLFVAYSDALPQPSGTYTRTGAALTLTLQSPTSQTTDYTIRRLTPTELTLQSTRLNLSNGERFTLTEEYVRQ